MLHRRQAPGRDVHKHFSLVPARSHTITTSNPQSAPDRIRWWIEYKSSIYETRKVQSCYVARRK